MSGLSGVGGVRAGRGVRAGGGAGSCAGSGLAVRLVLRSNRWFYLVWVLVLVACIAGTTSSYRTTIPDDASGRAVAAGLAANSTMRALLGPPYDLLHVGSFTMWRVGTFVGAMASIMAILGVVRSTRTPEEDGRIELLRSTPVGRQAPLTAALAVALGASLLFGALTAAALYGAQGEAAGAATSGAGMTLTATTFAGVGALAAQVCATGRAARFASFGVLGASYLVRTVADGLPDDASPGLHDGLREALQWASPSEWAALARPYAGERPWVLALPLALTVALGAAAFAVQARRDLGAGLVPARPGPARAGRSLSSAAGLGRALQRGSLLGWAAGLCAFALVAGFLATQFGSIVDERSDPQLAERFRRMGAGAQQLSDAFVVAMLGIVASLVALAALQLLGTWRAEERSGRAEAMLSTATSRTSFALAHVLPAAVGATALLAGFALVASLPSALGAGGRAGGVVEVGRWVGGALALAPGVWLCVGLAVLLHGLAPRLTVLAWVLVAWTLFVDWLGAILGLPDALLRATPFGPLPHLPGADMAWGPVLAQTAAAAVLVLLGLAAYRRRDL